MTRIRFLDVEDLTRSRMKDRKLSPRQLAAQKREAAFERAINKLEGHKVAVFEPTDEKLPTVRLSLGRVIARNNRAQQLHLAVKGGVAYVALVPIPGARRSRRNSKPSSQR